MTSAKRIWFFRTFLILLPFAGFLLVAAMLEVGARVYYHYAGYSMSGFSTPLHYLNEERPVDSLKKFAIPPHLSEKATHKGVPHKNYSEEADVSKAYSHLIYPNGIISLEPNIHQRLVKTLSRTGKVIYDVLLETDSVGRRLTPTNPQHKPDRHLIFYGCSYTFGEGVEPNQTLPFYAADATKKYRAYNLGMHGGSILEAWAYTNTLDRLRDIPEKKGAAVYVFFDDHLMRYKGAMKHLGTWGYTRPLVRPDKNGNVHFYGRWDDVRPISSTISQILVKSYFLNLIQFNFPPIQQKDLEDFVKVVASTREGYWKKFGSENPFIFLFYPSHSLTFAPRLKPLLEKAGIQYLDYSPVKLERLSDESMLIPYDNHPSAVAHKIIGRQIAEDLKLQ